jgi:SsrA-binding protein
MTQKNSIVTQNKKARHDYFIEQSYEAGINLKGTEVKSIREGKVSVNDAYVQIKHGEIFIINMHVSPYTPMETYLTTRKPERENSSCTKKRF